MVVTVATATVLVTSCSKKKDAAQHAFPDSLVTGEVVATVNDEPVTAEELKVLAYIATGVTDSLKVASFNLRLLDQMIERKLFAQEARAAGVAVSDSMVASVLDRFANQLGGEVQLESQLAPIGLTREDFREAISRDLTIRAYIDQRIIPSITVSEADSRAFYDQNPQMFAGQDSVHAEHIILISQPTDTEQQKQDRLARMEMIRKMAVSGKNFGELAREYSQDNTAARGGDLGYFPRGMMVKPFEDAAFALKKGQISNIVETQFGLHLIKCLDRKPARTIRYEEAESRIDMMLKQQSLAAEVRNRLQRSREAAIIVRNYETGA
jgi:peptidyl-prolyl cis-trans isomerase C